MTVKRAIALYDGSLKELSSADTLYSARTYHGIESFGVVSFNNTSHVVSVASGSNTYWYKGVRFYTTGAISCDLDDYVTLEANTLYYVYFDDATGTLKANSSMWNLREKVPVATVYWNGSVGAPSNECHGHDRGVGWHINAHLTIGCRYYEGLNVLKPTASLDSALEIEAGTLFDEDIQIDITPAKTNCRIWYLASAGKYTFVNSDLPYAGTSGQPQYLDTDTYALTNLGTSQYACMWVYGTGDTDRPIYIFPSAISTPYATIAGARAEAIPALSGLGLNPELKLLHRFIFRGNGEFQESEDFRKSSSLPSGFVASTSAGSVTFAPYSDITGTNVQTVIEQVQDEIDAISSSYCYIAYASDANGTGFTTTFNASLDYIAIKTTTTPIASPQASDFTGLWKNYKGAQGIQGIQGIPGAEYTPSMTPYTLLGRNTDTTGAPQIIERHAARIMIYAMQGCSHQLVGTNQTIAIDWNNGATQRVTLSQTGHIITFSNPYDGQVYRLKIEQGAGGSKTIGTWPTIKWAGGVVPVLTTTAGKYDIVTLLYDDSEYCGDVNKNF